jgi:hypothetical protein
MPGWAMIRVGRPSSRKPQVPVDDGEAALLAEFKKFGIFCHCEVMLIDKRDELGRI